MAASSLCGPHPSARATTPLHRLTDDPSGNADSTVPKAGLIIDAKGALCGTTDEGGHAGGSGARGFDDTGCGVVFRPSPPWGSSIRA